MQTTILDRIIQDKKIWLANQMQQQPLSHFIDTIQPAQRNFYQALSSQENVFILECKKASPSKGLIRADFNLQAITDVYRHYANAISVLTDETYFQGCFDYIRQVSQNVTQPVLCKDFIIDRYQIYLARYHQADAILLMLSVLDDQTYLELASLAHQLNMGVLTEVSNQQELTRAIALKAKVVGINNRNLRDLSINLETTKRLAPQLPKETIVISESGILHHQHIQELSSFVNGFLIGSALMAEDDLDLAVRKILFGHNKICGLTRREDAQAAYQSGALYGGLIFADRSPRCISFALAQDIKKDIPLLWVGIFTNLATEQIVQYATDLSLAAIQLHCHINQAEIDELRRALPESCQIWLALSATENFLLPQLNSIDHYVLDNGLGGTGQTFDWQILDFLDVTKIILAGGLNLNNHQTARTFNCFALDFNSGLEHMPGIKDKNKINQLFTAIRLNKRDIRI